MVIIYSGITLKWNYDANILYISMPGYVNEALHKLYHPPPTRPQNSPHHYNPPNYGFTSPQMAHQIDYPPTLDPEESNTFQKVVVTFMYFTLTFDPTIIVNLNRIVAEQANSAHAATKKVV